jgi:Tfp pilus assembly protein PilX
MIMGVVILFVLLGLGLALMMTAASQQKAAGNQQQTESAYALAEAALNAEIYQLATQWPTQQDASSTTAPNYGYPYSCSSSSNGSSYCPSTADLSTAYSPGLGNCPTGTPKDAWNTSSSPVQNGWTTYVRNVDSTSPSLFNSTTEETAARYDLNGSANPITGGAVWVRAVGVVNCKMAVLVTKVSDQIVAVNFPKYVLNANSFTITDSGNKDIINTQDTSNNTSQISLRCSGVGGLPPNSTCAGVQNSNQIQPTVNYSTSPAPSPTLTGCSQAVCTPNTPMWMLKQMAVANGTYFAPGSCPTSASQLAGAVVYVDGTNSQPCNMTFTANSDMNSSTSPGLLVIVNGTLTLGGSNTFWGVIWAANQGNLTGNVVTLQGTTTVVGGITVDGSGTAALNLGSSGNGAVSCTDTGGTGANKCGDLEFNLAAFGSLIGFAGADATPNTFRQLPNSQ